MMNKDINFFEKLSSSKRELEQKRFIRKVSLISLIPVGLMALLAFYVISANFTYKISISNTESYVMEPTRLAQFTEVNKVIQDTNYINSYKQDLLDVKAIISKKLKPDKNTVDKIEKAKPSDVKIMTMNMEEEQVEMTCVAQKSTSASDFVKALREKSEFKYVNYNGWTNDDGYNFTIKFYYKGEEASENQN